MKEFFHISKDISRITIDLPSNIKLFSSDLAISKMLGEYLLHLGGKLNSYEFDFKRLDNIISDIDNRLEKATPSYNLILSKRREYLSKGYEYHLKPYKTYLEQYDTLKSKMDEEVGVKELIGQVKKIIEGIKIDYNSLEVYPTRIFFLELLYCIFYPAENKELVELISKKMNASIIDQIQFSFSLEKYDIWSDKFDKEGVEKLMEELRDSLSVDSSNPDYDFYFILSLRQVPYNRINDFLKFHFDSYEDDFISFLKSSCDYFREHLNEVQIGRIEEWINNCKADSKKQLQLKTLL